MTISRLHCLDVQAGPDPAARALPDVAGGGGLPQGHPQAGGNTGQIPWHTQGHHGRSGTAPLYHAA